MKIGIDANEANISSRVGVNQYAYELLSKLHELQVNGKTQHEFELYLKSQPLPDMPKQTTGWKYTVLSGGPVWIATKLMPHLLLHPGRHDVFFSPTHYLPLLPGAPKVCTIHDLKYLENSTQFKKYDYWQLKLWTAKSISISKYIMAVSENTKKDIVRHYQVPDKKIVVTYHGVDRSRFNKDIPHSAISKVKRKYNLPADYILYIGTLKPSKNVEGLVSAFATLSQKMQDFDAVRLVIAGKKGWLYDAIFAKVTELGLTGKVIFTDFLPEADKPALLAGAKLLVTPSFTEGFGMQVLEGMACGIPVVVSNVDGLPEVAGTAGVYCDPHSVESIANSIEQVWSADKSRYNKLVNGVLAQSSKFSWDKTAQDTLATLEKAAHV